MAKVETNGFEMLRPSNAVKTVLNAVHHHQSNQLQKKRLELSQQKFQHTLAREPINDAHFREKMNHKWTSTYFQNLRYLDHKNKMDEKQKHKEAREDQKIRDKRMYDDKVRRENFFNRMDLKYGQGKWDKEKWSEGLNNAISDWTKHKDDDKGKGKGKGGTWPTVRR